MEGMIKVSYTNSRFRMKLVLTSKWAQRVGKAIRLGVQTGKIGEILIDGKPIEILSID